MVSINGTVQFDNNILKGSEFSPGPNSLSLNCAVQMNTTVLINYTLKYHPLVLNLIYRMSSIMKEERK